MVGEETRPLEVPDDGHSACGVFLDGPATCRFVCGYLVKEGLGEDGVVFFQGFFLFFGLHVSEVRVRLKLESFLSLQPPERLIPRDFMLLRDLKRPLRHNLAVILNSPDYVVHPVDLLQIHRHYLRCFIFFLTGSQGVEFFLLGMGVFFFIFGFFWFYFFVHEVWVACD